MDFYRIEFDNFPPQNIQADVHNIDVGTLAHTLHALISIRHNSRCYAMNRLARFETLIGTRSTHTHHD